MSQSSDGSSDLDLGNRSRNPSGRGRGARNDDAADRSCGVENLNAQLQPQGNERGANIPPPQPPPPRPPPKKAKATASTKRKAANRNNNNGSRGNGGDKRPEKPEKPDLDIPGVRSRSAKYVPPEKATEKGKNPILKTTNEKKMKQEDKIALYGGYIQNYHLHVSSTQNKVHSDYEHMNNTIAAHDKDHAKLQEAVKQSVAYSSKLEDYARDLELENKLLIMEVETLKERLEGKDSLHAQALQSKDDVIATQNKAFGVEARTKQHEESLKRTERRSALSVEAAKKKDENRHAIKSQSKADEKEEQRKRAKELLIRFDFVA